MKTLRIVAALALLLLGGLWLLQGLGLVHLRPILCFADCEPIQDPSAAWAIIGAAAVVGGVMLMRRSRRA